MRPLLDNVCGFGNYKSLRSIELSLPYLLYHLLAKRTACGLFGVLDGLQFVI